jgi:prepilin peptidase CpaA
MPFPVLAPAILTSCVALLGIAALHDLIARTIPNWIAALLALIALVPLPGTLGIWNGLPAVALVFAGMFGGAVLFWRLGWLGGGDAKLLGAIGLLVPPGRIGVTVTAIALAGGVLALPYVVCRGRIARPAPFRPTGVLPRAWRAERYRLRRGGPLPYAVAIAIGTAFGLLGGPP